MTVEGQRAVREEEEADHWNGRKDQVSELRRSRKSTLTGLE
jgi:hypothetical protein